MFESKNNYLLESKGINHVVSTKNGREYDLQTLYLKDNNGVLTTLVVNSALYNKAEVGKSYKIKVYLDYRGTLSVNDIELAK